MTVNGIICNRFTNGIFPTFQWTNNSEQYGMLTKRPSYVKMANLIMSFRWILIATELFHVSAAYAFETSRVPPSPVRCATPTNETKTQTQKSHWLHKLKHNLDLVVTKSGCECVCERSRCWLSGRHLPAAHRRCEGAARKWKRTRQPPKENLW